MRGSGEKYTVSVLNEVKIYQRITTFYVNFYITRQNPKMYVSYEDLWINEEGS